MSALWLAVGLVAVVRLLELAYAARNTRRLLEAGGREAGREHYPLIVGLHAVWLLALLIAIDPAEPPRWPLLILFIALQGLRLWVIASLGGRWTTRVITLPGAPLVRRGPYRWLRHPNYMVVIAEIAVLPLAFGAWQIALVFTVLNLALLRHRVRIEEQALATGE
jgi:methyltransferase